MLILEKLKQKIRDKLISFKLQNEVDKHDLSPAQIHRALVTLGYSVEYQTTPDGYKRIYRLGKGKLTVSVHFCDDE